MALASIESALAQILADVRPLSEAANAIEQVTLRRAHGRILAREQICSIDVPPADNSAMDGYALRAADYRSGQALPVSQRIAAGAVAQPLQAGTVARIFTGAELPFGADAVVMQENCTLTDSGVLLDKAIKIGENVRPRGQDMQRGQSLAQSGQRLSSTAIALLAATGVAEVPVYRRIKVALLSTGDELVEPGEAIGPAQIYNSNRPLLIGLLQELGCEVVDFGIVADSAEAAAAALQRAAQNSDCVISTGGVSAGEEDHVRAQLEKHGQLRFWKLNIKPGKPLAYGRMQGVPFFGLPGNPASAFVTFFLVARPYLQRLQGEHDIPATVYKLPAAFDWPRPGSRQEYLRARIVAANQGLQVEIFPNQSSGVLMSVAWANALVVVAPQQTIAHGDIVDVLPLTPLL